MQKRLTYSLCTLALLAGLTACSSNGGSKFQAPEIATSSSNTIPVAVVKVSEQNATTDRAIVFDASQSYDNDGDTLQYEWKDANGKLLATTPKLNRLFTDEGTHAMTLYVYDDKGGVNTKTVSVKVTRHNSTPPAGHQPPVAKAFAVANGTQYDATTPIHITSGDIVHFEDDGSYDPDGGSITSYEWRDMDGILLSDTKILDRKLVYRPEYDPGDGTNKYIKTLYVTDDEGQVSKISFTVYAHKAGSNQPPVADLGPDQTILAGNSVTLNAHASDPDGVIDYYVWKKGATVVAEGPYMSTFTTDLLGVGDHTFSVTVRDNDGAETTDSVTIHVSATGSTGGSN